MSRRRHSCSWRFLVWLGGLALAGLLADPARADDCGCAICDLDSDGDVDQSDFGVLQTCLTGPYGV